MVPAGAALPLDDNPDAKVLDAEEVVYNLVHISPKVIINQLLLPAFTTTFVQDLHSGIFGSSTHLLIQYEVAPCSRSPRCRAS
jgi:hypothetical protein